MPGRVPWFERRFSFDFPAGVFPEVLERLRGTPARAEDLARGVPEAILVRREGATWSIQENLAHLSDLEALFAGRLDDFDAGLPVLRAADLTNRRTHEARHNERTIGSVLAELRAVRESTIARLERLAPEGFARGSRHPRLDTPMRVVDLMFFHAEHDDYHLARARELLRRARG